MLFITVEFLNRSYEGRGSQGSDFPPSPWRIVSALVSGAYAGGDSNLEVHNISQLCHHGDPDFIAVPRSFKKKSIDTLYMEKNAASVGNAEIRATQFKDQRMKKVAKPHHGGHVVIDHVTYVWEHIEGVDKSLLQSSASRIPYIGKATNPALVSVSSDSAKKDQLLQSDDHFLIRKNSLGNLKLRSINSSTIDLLDERYESIFGTSSKEKDYNIRVPESRWGLVANLEGNNDLFIIPVKKGFSFRNMASVMESFEEGVVFPIVDSLREHSTGEIKAVGILNKNGAIPKQDANLDWIGSVDLQNMPKLLQQETWSKKSSLWKSTMPLLSHPDERVAVWMIEKSIPGATVVSISKKPLVKGQRQIKGIPSNMVPYHIVLTTQSEVAGPLVIDKDNGTGVLVGIKEGDIA